MFRASPWITYDPPASDSQPSQPMDNDTEMDAPQISTLHDDGESPPSNSPARTGKFRVKLLVNETKMSTKFIPFNGETGEEARVTEEAEEDEPDEDEEDELMEEEAGDASTGTPAGASSSGGAGASSTTKSGTKRPSTKTKSSQARRKARLNAPSTAPTTSLPAPVTSEMQDDPAKDVQDAPPSVEPPSTVAPEATPPAVSAPTSKKKVVPKGTTAAQRAPRKSAPK